MLTSPEVAAGDWVSRKTLRVDDRSVDCYLLHIGDQALQAGDWSLLDARENARAQRLLRTADRLRFVRCRAMLRRLLAGYLGESPQAIELATGRWGKPFLPRSALKFNLSHSGDSAVIACSFDTEIGIDIEYGEHLGSTYEALARRVLVPEELKVLRTADPAGRRACFLDMWMAKEALLKYLGTGLSLEPARVALDLNGGAPIGFLSKAHSHRTLIRVRFPGRRQQSCYLVI